MRNRIKFFRKKHQSSNSKTKFGRLMSAAIHAVILMIIRDLNWLLALLNFNLFYILSRKEIRSVKAVYLQKCHSSSSLCFDNFCL